MISKRAKSAKNRAKEASAPSWWFWVWLLEITTKKLRNGKMSSSGEVWENLIVVRAGDAKEAYEKAFAIGKSSEGDCRGTLCLDGVPALTKFLGITDLGLIHDGLADGSEILFRQRRQSLTAARSRVKSRSTLIARATKELAPYQKSRG
jgi:hypothetical protein